MSFLSRAFSRAIAPPLAGPSRQPINRNPLSTQPRVALFSSSAPSLVKQKLKSHSGCKKRFFANAGGMAQTGKSHLNTAFSSARINRLAKSVYVTKTQAKTLRKLLPYA
ncbi:ribosomal protein L35 [Kwoniella sp. DSM 27419]